MILFSLFLVIWIHIRRNYFCISFCYCCCFVYLFILFSLLYFHVHDGMIRREYVPISSNVNIIWKWSWCPVFRCLVQTRLFELDGSSCFSFNSRGGWYSLMRPRRFHSRFFSDIEWISRNSASVSLLFFYLSILFFLIPVQPWIW